MVAVVHGREMEEESNIKSLANRAELLHQDVIEARKMFVVERLDDRIGEHDGARNNGVGVGRASLQHDLVEDAEVMLGKSLRNAEMCNDMRVADLFEGECELFALPAAPARAATQAHEFA